MSSKTRRKSSIGVSPALLILDDADCAFPSIRTNGPPVVAPESVCALLDEILLAAHNLILTVSNGLPKPQKRTERGSPMPHTDDSYEQKGLANIEYDLLSENIKSLTADMKEFKVAFEQSRRDVAAGFVPRDILDLRIVNLQAQMTVLEQKFSDFREEIRRNEQKAIGNVERIWLRVGTTGGVIGVIVAVLEYLQKTH